MFPPPSLPPPLPTLAQAVVLALEDGKESCAEKIVSLLQHMAQATIITQDQFNQGFLRIFNDMTDIVLDVPNAYHMLSKFVDKGEAAGFVRPAVAEQLPQRSVSGAECSRVGCLRVLWGGYMATGMASDETNTH